MWCLQLLYGEKLCSKGNLVVLISSARQREHRGMRVDRVIVRRLERQRGAGL